MICGSLCSTFVNISSEFVQESLTLIRHLFMISRVYLGFNGFCTQHTHSMVYTHISDLHTHLLHIPYTCTHITIRQFYELYVVKRVEYMIIRRSEASFSEPSGEERSDLGSGACPSTPSEL